MGIIKRKHYKFTNKRTPKRGVAAVLLFVLAVVLVGTGIYLSFLAHGAGGLLVGAFGMLAFVASLIGLFLGIQSLKDVEVFHIASWVGAIGNAVICIIMMLLIMIGL